MKETIEKLKKIGLWDVAKEELKKSLDKLAEAVVNVINKM